MLAAGFSENFSESLTSVSGFFRTGGWFMFPLGVCWFLSLTVIFWKCLELRRRGILPPDLTADMENAEGILSTGRFQAFLGRLRADDSVLAKISRTALSGRHPDKASATRAAESVAREEIAKLERGVPVLEIIFTIAPMLGLIGTVSGLVRIFSSFGGAGPGHRRSHEHHHCRLGCRRARAHRAGAFFPSHRAHGPAHGHTGE